jgi:hypothetical protein
MTTTMIYPTHNLVSEYGEWLRTFSWDLFGTLTFDPSRARHSSASRATALSSYLNSLERHYKARVRCFWAEEMRWSGCGLPAIAPHFHLLLGSDRCHLDPSQAKSLWEGIAGNADMRIYDPALSGAEYCAKLIGQANANYDFFHFPTSPVIVTATPVITTNHL